MPVPDAPYGSFEVFYFNYPVMNIIVGNGDLALVMEHC